MAFALTLFVQAANRNLAPPQARDQPAPEDDSDVCERLYSTLLAEVEPLPSGVAAPQPPRQASLYTAFSTLCGYYDGDPLQTAVCARVLAFYLFMERTAGAALPKWTQPHPDKPELMELHPALVEAIGTVRLNGSVLLRENALRDTLARIASSSGSDQTA